MIWLRCITVMTSAMGVLLPMAGRADGPPVTPAARADAALHLLEGGRYGEAIPAAQMLVDMAPNDPLAYQVRGTLEMYVGRLDTGQQDFQTAADLLSGSPVTLFGLGLSQIGKMHWDEAQASLSLIGQAPDLSNAQKSDLTTTLAYIDYLHGDLDKARLLAETPPAAMDLTRQELLALIAVRSNPMDGIVPLTTFLQTAGGVPRVCEDEGLRPLFDPAVSLESAVTEPSLRQMYAASLRDNRARSDRQAKFSQRLSGDVTLKTPSGLGSTAAAVTFTIDGQLAGMVNTAPYEYLWQTKSGGNGRHAIRIDALDTSGNVISTTTRQVSVFNTQPGSTGAGMAADPALETRVWNLLRLRPARKVAEWTLGGLIAQQDDTAGARTHRAIAAALDPDYKDGRRTARTLFGAGSEEISLTAQSAKLQGLWRGSSARKLVALTFDDGPNPQKTPLLLDALDKAGAPATFFVVGARAEAAPDIVRRMAERGDDVEDHSYTHPNMAQTAAPIAESEILRTTVVIRALTGKQPRFFRPPGGQRNPVVYRLASQYGQKVTLWTIDALNYEEAGSPQGLVDFVMKHMQSGAIVLMHNGMDSTVAAIPGLVAALHAKGYQIVTLSQLTSGAPAVKATAFPR